MYKGQRVEIEGVTGPTVTDFWSDHKLFGPGIVLQDYCGPHLISMGLLSETYDMTKLPGGDLLFTHLNGVGPHFVAGKDDQRLYWLRQVDLYQNSKTTAKGLLARKTSDIWVLHRILHHPGPEALKELIRSGELD